jgi:hypothetical protein
MDLEIQLMLELIKKKKSIKVLLNLHVHWDPHKITKSEEMTKA